MSDYTLETGKKGFYTLKFRGRAIHSAIDPYAEAQRFIPSKTDSNLYIVFGLGLGYHIQALIERLSHPDFHIIVFEESDEIIEFYHQAGIINDSRVIIFKNSQFGEFMDFFHDSFLPYQILNPIFLELKSETLLFPDAFQKTRAKVEEFFRYYFQSLFTEAEFIHLWYRNILINAPKIFTPAFSMYLEGDAFLVAAGPSLAENLPLLKKYNQKIPMFVVDTALKPVVDAGIVPDVVVATDPQIHNYRDFFFVRGFEKMILAVDIACYYKIPEHFKQVFFFKTQSLGDDLFNEMNEACHISLPEFPGGGSVSSSALTLLFYLGARRVFMVGQDFCYPNLTHSRSAVNHQRAVFTTGKLNPLWNFFQNIISQRGKRDLFMQNLSKWVEDFTDITGIIAHQISPMVKLKNTIEGFPKEISGKLYLFNKSISRDKRNIQNYMEEFLESLMILRNSKNYEEFEELKDKIQNPCIMKAFLKQDLYLKRMNGDKDLYLGGCFRILDRMIRACSYEMTRKNEIFSKK